jgi:hypothetical protein
MGLSLMPCSHSRPLICSGNQRIWRNFDSILHRSGAIAAYSVSPVVPEQRLSLIPSTRCSKRSAGASLCCRSRTPPPSPGLSKTGVRTLEKICTDGLTDCAMGWGLGVVGGDPAATDTAPADVFLFSSLPTPDAR